jgi:uncharacterized protein
MTEERIEDADLILLLLAAPTKHERLQSRCDGITRLEKLLFLVEKETDISNEIDETFPFEPYHYGPYSKEVYQAVDLLTALQLLDERRIDASSSLDVSEEFEALDEFDISDDRYIERQLLLTSDGRDVANVLSRQLSPKGKSELTRIKDSYGGMSLRQLLRYVYASYPEYASKSLIRDRV